MKKINKVIIGVVGGLALLTGTKNASASTAATSRGYSNTNLVVTGAARVYQDPNINVIRNTDQLNAKPTATPTVTLPPKPTATPTPKPTPKPSSKPTVKPSPKPSAKPTPKTSSKSTPTVSEIVVNNIEKPLENLISSIKKLFGF